jgi:hypothetical protein
MARRSENGKIEAVNGQLRTTKEKADEVERAWGGVCMCGTSYIDECGASYIVGPVILMGVGPVILMVWGQLY